MCELFGICSSTTVELNTLLKEFYQHSTYHPHGWGLATFHGNAVSLEKEPVQASRSAYLKARLKHSLKASTAIAHIRLATVGNMEYENSHPFIMRDNYNRCWTLAHNGTIFDGEILDTYFYEQEGRTDSERILYRIIDLVNQKQDELGHALSRTERFLLLDQIICSIAPHNKLNLLIYDGECFYVHTNYANSLYIWQMEDKAWFCTVPLSKGDWKPVPFTTLCVYRNGKQVFTGTNHGFEYRDDIRDTKYLFVDFSEL